MLPKIKVFSLGGTIAMGAMKEGRGVSLSHSAEMLIDAVPALAEIAQIEGISFRQMPSPDLTMNDLIALSKAISESIDGGAAGIVVTQGTDTLEESAFVIDRLVEADAPVVFTGAMRNPTMPSPDGAANLYHAVITALAKETLGIGTLVVLNDEIHAARYVQKLHTTSPAAFQSSPVGPIGWVLENQAHLLAKPFKRYLIAGVSESAKIRVARLTVSIDDDGEMVDYVTRAGFDGLVIEATGGGHVPKAMVNSLESAAQKMPVVFASRTRHGETMRSTYDFPGAETSLIRHGLVPGGWLPGIKARLLLVLALGAGLTTEQIKLLFEDWRFPLAE